MEFKVQRVQQGPPFHPLESSRLVEARSPIIRFRFLKLKWGTSPSTDLQSQMMFFTDGGGSLLNPPLHRIPMNRNKLSAQRRGE